MLALIATTILMVQPGISACRASHLIASLDDRDGDFNGMSHSGTLMMLRNKGAACRIVALPQVRFSDARHRSLPIRRRVTAGLHPEPVMVSVIVPARGVVSTPLRWISGPVFDPGRCLRPARVAIMIDGRALSSPLRASICGPTDQPATFDQPPLRAGLNEGW